MRKAGKNFSAADLPFAADLIFVRGKLAQPHRPARVKFLGGDAHFRAQTEFKAVGKAGARIDVDGGAVHFIEELFRGGGVFGDDRVAVVRAVPVDV